ncbi:hypothetical protein BCR43DRAFT_490070 [Syncephalastrum racemosum]|uniref:Uncharacterized protein n=1 Tax=Syncephalastrum racemosum TaxID=13706 RepID=A0A1X2HFD3_SYNRA|nr:hypothetical protein BCR43DRAFT_490070 [Syncephalastrum racemosum]
MVNKHLHRYSYAMLSDMNNEDDYPCSPPPPYDAAVRTPSSNSASVRLRRHTSMLKVSSSFGTSPAQQQRPRRFSNASASYHMFDMFHDLKHHLKTSLANHRASRREKRPQDGKTNPFE